MHILDNRSLCCYSIDSVLFLVWFSTFARILGFYGVTCSYSSRLFLRALDATSASDGHILKCLMQTLTQSFIRSYALVGKTCMLPNLILPWNFILFRVPSFILLAMGHPGWCSRAIGVGQAGPAAAGPIFGQLNCAKMPYELRRVVQLFLSN